MHSFKTVGYFITLRKCFWKIDFKYSELRPTRKSSSHALEALCQVTFSWPDKAPLLQLIEACAQVRFVGCLGQSQTMSLPHCKSIWCCVCPQGAITLPNYKLLTVSMRCQIRLASLYVYFVPLAGEQ